MKRPSFQFYPADWRNDAALKLCSLSARGLWIEMICIMHMAEPYGHLCAAGRALDVKDLAKLVGESAREVQKWLDELTRNEVCGYTDDGVILSRRMVRDEALREVRAEGGKAGKEFGKMGAEHGKKGGRPRKETGVKKPPLNPPPSSSSSSSSSTSEDQEQEQRGGTPPALTLPDWLPADAWADWHAYRNSRKGWTTKARQLSLKTLCDLHDAGHDARKVIDLAIERGWTGLFAPRDGPPGRSPTKPPIAQNFSQKNYSSTGTPDDELPEYLRAGTA